MSFKKRIFKKLILILSITMLLADSQSVFSTVTSYTNPIISTVGPADPTIMQYNGTYYMYPTNNSTSYQVWTSNELVSYTQGNTVWSGTSNVWAPDVKYDAASCKFVMYATDNYNIKCATATSPIVKNAFTTVSTFGSIGGLDACLFIDNDGKYYLYYSGSSAILCRPLTSATSYTAAETKLLSFVGAASNELDNIIEGPYVVRWRDTYYMLYSSGNANTADYRTLYATAKSPLGPWIRNSTPLLQRDNVKGIYGPGHGCLTQDAAGKWWYMYQQKQTTAAAWNRQLAIDQVFFNNDGTLFCTPTRGTSVAAGPTTFSGNPLPTSTLSAPTTGSVVAVGASVPFTATATDNGSIAKVEFYVDNVMVNSTTTSPYTYTWTATAGTHWIEAWAYDNTGALTRSNANKLIVGNQPPTVSFNAPANNWKLPINSAYTIQATASDPDGTVARVDFYANGVLIGTANSSPFSISYTATTYKSYIELKAIATDNNGLTSDPAQIISGVGMPIVTTPNLALNKPVTTSNGTGSAAVDGNIGTSWGTSASGNQWVSVDLGTSYNINEVVIFWDIAFASSYLVQVSADNSIWTTIYSTTSGVDGVVDLKGLSGSGRYLRVYCTAKGGTMWGYSIFELQVFGFAGAIN